MHNSYCRTLFVFGYTFLSIFFARGQEEDNANKLKLGLTIAQGSENTYTQSLPAKFVATFPDNPEVDDTFTINGSVSLDVFKGYKENSPFKASLVFEKHKNTLIEKEQDVTQIGARIEFLLRQGGELYPTWYHIPSFSIKQSNDRINDKRGLQYLAYYSIGKPTKFKKFKLLNTLRPNVIYPSDKRNNLSLDIDDKDTITVKEYEQKKKEGLKINWSKLDFADFLQFRHNHAIGVEHLEYENLTMMNFSFNVQLYPFSGLLYSAFKKYGVLELKYAVTHREELSSSDTSLFVGTYLNRGAAINIKFDDEGKKIITIGYDHFQGGNPLKGLADNDYGQFTIGTILKL